MMRKERACQEQIDRKPRTAAHQRRNQHSDKAALRAFDGSACHYGGHIAPEAHNQRNKAFSVQAHSVHQLIHNKGGARHIAGILHKRYKEIKDKDLRQEYNNAAHTANYSIHQQITEWTGRHHIGNNTAQPSYKLLNP